MQIVIGLLALEYKVISEPLFVAIVMGALLTSMVAGPWMKAALWRARRLDILGFFSPECVCSSLVAAARDAAIAELCALAAPRTGTAEDGEALTRAVREREQIMGTALGDGVAVPHARVPDLPRATVAVGRSATGLEWDAPDGQHVHLVFLVLTPVGGDDVQLRILRAIGDVLRDPGTNAALRESTDDGAMWETVRRSLMAQAPNP
jgi:mannitol/fructose-specific phosphotransferase system IIA component (Ntr-type)